MSGPDRLCSTRLNPEQLTPEQLNPAQLDSVRLGVRADRGAPLGDGHFRRAADRSDPSPRLDGGVGVPLRTSRLAPVPGPVMQVSGPKRRTEGSGGAVGRGTGAVGRDGLTFRLRRVRRVRPGGGAGAVGAVGSGGLRRRKGGCAGTRRRSNRDGTAPGRGGRPAGRNAARPNFPAARESCRKARSEPPVCGGNGKGRTLAGGLFPRSHPLSDYSIRVHGRRTPCDMCSQEWESRLEL